MERSQVRNDYLFAVVQIDIDRFKDVNDSLGHLVGDQLLQSIGQILLDTVSAVDTVARLGDDEFVVLLEELPSKKAGTATIKKIKAALNRTLDIEYHPIHISACFGAIFGPNEYSSPEYFLQGANIALRHAQEQGLDQLRFYAPEMQDKAVRKLDTETRLRNAISENELFLALQPIFSIDQSPTLSGFEALLRWKPKDKDWVPPANSSPSPNRPGSSCPSDSGCWNNPVRCCGPGPKNIRSTRSACPSICPRASSPTPTWCRTCSTASGTTASILHRSSLKSRKATS